MFTSLRQIATLSLLLFGFSAQANFVKNGSFEQRNGTAAQTNPSLDHTSFSSYSPTNWSIASGGLSYVLAPGTADGSGYLSVWGPFPNSSPDGGNFVMQDGDTNYSRLISQTITGLTVGQSYLLSFYEAAGQQKGFNGATTEGWKVGFGSDVKYSSIISLASHGVGPWQLETMRFTARSQTQILTFLAQGTPNGQPPMSFLDGVSLEEIPEPTSLWLIFAGLLGWGTIQLRRTGKITS